MNDRYTLILETPFRPLQVDFTKEAVLRISWIDESELQKANPSPVKVPLASQIVQEISEYFDGRRKVFTLPCILPEGRPFFQRVWQEIMLIPYGETVSYGELSRRAGKVKCAARAVGQACARNPLPLIIPCHRVVKSDGSLGYYSAPDGESLKARLIAFERRNLNVEGR